MSDILHIKSIAQAHSLLGLPEPKHPLISVNMDCDANYDKSVVGHKITFDNYLIFFKEGVEGSMGYGRNSYDFENSTMVFIAPGQVLELVDCARLKNSQGFSLTFHPDLIRKSGLGSRIDEYDFFSYESNEALHLSAIERTDIEEIIGKIKREYEQNIDQHSQALIISNLELLLNYCLRFYDRQFYTRSNFNKDIVADFAKKLSSYFSTGIINEMGVPSVKYFAAELNMSPNYLSDMLKKETGKSAKSHINDFMVNKAKNELLGTAKAINEIAYELGFEYPQGLNKLFKKETGMTPAEYRINSN
ncbi:MAG: helix-turn-helix domain-containing protein [Bacteroidia bacterium]